MHHTHTFLTVIKSHWQHAGTETAVHYMHVKDKRSVCPRGAVTNGVDMTQIKFEDFVWAWHYMSRWDQHCVSDLHLLFYWSLLLQPQDQIEVGDDGFRQWDGKNGFRCRKKNSNVFPPFHDHFFDCLNIILEPCKVLLYQSNIWRTF